VSLLSHGVAPRAFGHLRQSGREFHLRYWSLMDKALADAKSRVRLDLGLGSLGASPDSLLADRAALKEAEARALKQGVPSTSLARRVLWDVAHERAGRCKAELEREFTSAGKDALSALGALRAAFESAPKDNVDLVEWLVTEEANVDKPLDEIHDSARYPSVEDSHEGPLEASSEVHARQQDLPRVAQAKDARGAWPWRLLDDSSEATEVGGHDFDDDADYGGTDSEASSEPAPDADLLGGPSDINDPRWAEMSATDFGLGKKAMRDFPAPASPRSSYCRS
jgi:hypothetical protein